MTALLCAATTTSADIKRPRIQHACQTPENCSLKCADGAYHLSQPKRHSVEVPELRCNGTHDDYRWGGLLCTQTVGPEMSSTRHNCPRVHGTVCSRDEKGYVGALCIAEMTYLSEFMALCSHGHAHWSAEINWPDLTNECPPSRHKPTNMTDVHQAGENR